ncbi:MAG: M3 family metallopeptidase [Acidobacteria bacterium]|nr:M3 family metallopeptidase [Acidobacteriota bacterium]
MFENPSHPAPPVETANPLTLPWPGPWGGVPPWDRVTARLFPEAFEQAIAAQRVELDAIAGDTAPPTFENTMVKLEGVGRMLDRLQALFGVMVENVNSPDYQALDHTWSPRLAAAADEITFNRALFERIEAVHAARHASGLTGEQVRLVEKTHERFVRSGARLDQAQQARLGQINQELAGLFADFSARILADEDRWVTLESEADLAGLSSSQIASARAAALERGLTDRWVIVNTRSSVDPFLASSDRRDLREQVWRAFKNRGDNNDAHDTKALIVRIVRLRGERARLLGYSTHAHWRMADTMARDPEQAQALMKRVWPAAVARVREEVRDMQAVADAEGCHVTIEPWDYLYYAEKVRKARFDIDQNEIRPYFELEQMIQAAFWAAGQLFGIAFRENTGDLPVFHPDVRTWEVTDAATGAHVGVFYGDNYARPGKRSGAWAEIYRWREGFDGLRTPIASNNNNFIKGAPGESTLLSTDDVRTLFHEFGHALHALLSEVTYPSLGPTPRDFVEVPSQLNEYWARVRPVLDRFARHYETGEPMPQALLDRVLAAETFNQGYVTVEYLACALLDMELHLLPDGIDDVAAFERDALARIGMPREIALRHRLPQFSHLFGSDAYSAGYYSYLWSEVMDADARGAFEEAGNPFDRAAADRLRRFLLAPGNSTDRGEAYRQFRGRDPEPDALLEGRGLHVR